MNLILRNYFISLWILSFACANAQKISFLPLDEKLSQFPRRTSVNSEGELLALGAVQMIGFQTASMSISKWNGQFWTTYPVIQADQFQVSDENRLSVCTHASQIFAAGSFRSYDTAKAGIVFWNGIKWEKPAGGITSDYLIHQDVSFNDMISFGNKLFVCGRFNLAGGQRVNNFAYLSNNQWFPVQTSSGIVNDFEIINDTLYCGGRFDQVDGVSSTNISAYFNGQWMGIPGVSASTVIGLGNFNGHLISFTNNTASIKSGNTWIPMLQNWDFSIQRLSNSSTFDGKLYVAGTFLNSKGEKSHLLRWDGQAWEIIVKHADVYPKNQTDYFIDKKGSDLLFSGCITRFFGTSVQHVIQLFPGKTVVKGRLYFDANENCSFDGLDAGISNALISVNEGQYFTSCDINGLYSVVLEMNKKSSLRIFPANDKISSCQNAYIEIISGSGDSSVILDFALQLKPSPPPLQDLLIVSPGGFKVRHGFNTTYNVKYKATDGKFPLIVTLQFDKRLKGITADLEPESVSENEMVWTIYANTEIHLNALIDPMGIKTGDKLIFNLSSRFNDSILIKPLHHKLEQEVVSAYDPNEKQCSESKIPVNGKTLEYRVQFQNLGNDSAVNIHVVDTISGSLPMQFIQVLDYSHKNNYDISFKVRDHAIIWSFNNILLPPKNLAGDKESSGFIQFKSGLDQLLKVGDSISNQAHIYFDYQAPVHTNTVVTKVIEKPPYNPNGSGELELYVYPNPVGSFLTLEMSPFLMRDIRIFDISGKLIYHKILNPYTGKTTIEPELSSSGIYILRVEHAFGVISRKIVVSN